MSSITNTGNSLAQHVENFIVKHPENDWLKLLRIGTQQTDSSRAADLNLTTNNRFSPEYHDMVASRFARALLPALSTHPDSKQDQVYSIRIHTANEGFVDKGIAILDQALGIDLGELRREVIAGLTKLGAQPESSSFYNIHLGGTQFRIITVFGQLDKMKHSQFDSWRKTIKRDHGVNIRFQERHSHKPTLLTAQESDLSISNLIKLSELYTKTQRYRPIPAALISSCEDWRDLNCMSIDSAGTRRPADILHLTKTEGNHILLRTAIPFSTSDDAIFSPFQDRICIGITLQFDQYGNIVSKSITPVIAHNTFALDSYSVSCAASSTSFQANSRIGSRVSQIREYAPLSEQISLFYDLADRIISRYTEPGSAISFHLTDEGSVTDADAQAISSDYLVGCISKITQHAIAEWVFGQSNPTALIAMRPEFSRNQTIDSIREIIPTLSTEDLLQPALLSKIGDTLFAGGHHRLIQELAELLESGQKKPRLQVISPGADIVPDDRIKIKSIHSRIGLVNNLQVQCLMLGLPILSEEILQGVIKTIRKDGAQSPDAHHITRQLEAVAAAIQDKLSS
jgi:hypothetical protein